MKSLAIYTLLIWLTVQAREAKAQQVSIAFVVRSSILQQMPEFRQAMNKIDDFRNQSAMKLNHKGKWQPFSVYVPSITEVPPSLINHEQTELKSLTYSLLTHPADVLNDSLQQMYKQLINPILAKVHQAIISTAKQANYTYIINADQQYLPAILYAAKGNDITNLVLNELGIETSKWR